MPAKPSSPLITYGKESLLPQEEMLEIGKKKKQLVIGIPKEIKEHESRVALTPEAVELLVNNGHEVIIETGAGVAARYQDTHYSECGGFIVESRKEVFQADIILKIAALREEEINLLKGNQLVFSALNVPNRDEKYFRGLMKKKITAIAFESLKDENNCFPIVKSMSEIAGNAAVLIASEYMTNAHGGKGVLLGGITGITPAEVVILGAGTAGEFAARASMGLGAVVKVFDSSLHRLRRIQDSLGSRLFTSIYHPPSLRNALVSADVLIGAVHLLEEGARYYVTEEMVKLMKKGAVIVDISIDQGGCVETSEFHTHEDPVFIKHDVIHYCVPNIPSRVARTASIALSNIFTPLLLEIGDSGGLKPHLKENSGLRKGVYIFNGILTSNYIGRRFGMLSKDINLLLAAF